MNLIKNEHGALKLLLLFVFEFNGAKIGHFLGIFLIKSLDKNYGGSIYSEAYVRIGPSCNLYYNRYCGEQSRDEREAKIDVFGKRGTEVCLFPKLSEICWIETHFLRDSCVLRAGGIENKRSKIVKKKIQWFWREVGQF